ncbi:hypothetical protein P9112_009543 [Eukaryota sp. TZLM1-RC]
MQNPSLEFRFNLENLSPYTINQSSSLSEKGYEKPKTTEELGPSELSLNHYQVIKHKTKALEYFCQQCSIPVCVNCCLVDGHSSHGDMHPLDEALDICTWLIIVLN